MLLKSFTEKGMIEKIRKFQKEKIDFLNELATKMNSEMEWAKVQHKCVGDTIIEINEQWKELVEDDNPEDYYESLRNLILENVCEDGHFTEDKTDMLNEAIIEKLKFLDYTWEDNFEAKYKNEVEKEILRSFEKHLNQDPSEIYKLGRKDDLRTVFILVLRSQPLIGWFQNGPFG